MGERKVLDKYNPPDFDPAKIPGRKNDKNKQIKVRMMLPMSIRCTTCGTYIYKGTKFNSRKEDVVGETYLGIQIFRFYFKCTKCSAELTMKTDPQNSDYVVESGAARNFESWRAEDEVSDIERKRREAEEMEDARKILEDKALDSKKDTDILAALEEMKSVKTRHEMVRPEDLLEVLKRRENNQRITHRFSLLGSMTAGGSYDKRRKQDGWSIIHRDILERILNKLGNVLLDLVRCGAVCKWWQSILLENHPALAAGVPLLMCVAWSNVFEYSVIDVFNKKLYRLPSLNNRSLLTIDINTGVIGSSFGWLVIMEESVVQLLNPITKACILLPPTNTFIRVVLSSDPRRTACMVVAFFYSNRRLYFCRIGDKEWTVLGPETGELYLYDDLLYHKGLFYAITQSGVVVAWDITSEPKMTMVIPQNKLEKVWHKPEHVRHRCLSFVDNDLLMVIWGYYRHEIYIHKLDVMSKKWEELKSLDDRIFFVAAEYLYAPDATKPSIFMSISANEMNGCTPNRMYFRDMIFYELESKRSQDFGRKARFLSYPLNWITLPQL